MKHTYYTKLCETIGIGYIAECSKGNDYSNCCTLPIPCEKCKYLIKNFPEFNIEKQMKMIKLISFETGIMIKQNRFFVCFEPPHIEKLIRSEHPDLDFAEGLAGLALYLVLANKIQESEVRKVLEE